MALSPFAVGAFSIIKRGYPAGALFGDRAILALTARDAWRAPVLLGPYSRFYWHHPGPLYFYVLNVLSSLFGGRPVGLVLGAIAINVAAAVGILVLAHRRGGRPLLVWASLLLTAYLVAIEPIPFDIWNPSVTLLPFALVLLLAWSVACRDWWAAPWFALVALVRGADARRPRAGCRDGARLRRRRQRVAAAATASVPLRDDERRTLRRSVARERRDHRRRLAATGDRAAHEPGRQPDLAGALLHPTGKSAHVLRGRSPTPALQATLMLRGVLRADLAPCRWSPRFGRSRWCSPWGRSRLPWRRRGRLEPRTCSSSWPSLPSSSWSVSTRSPTSSGPIQFYLVQWISAVGFVLWLAVGKATIEFARTRWSEASGWRTLTRGAAIVLLGVLCFSTVRGLSGGRRTGEPGPRRPQQPGVVRDVPTAQLLAATRRAKPSCSETTA